MWSGSNSTSFATAPFKVTNTGDVTANSLTLTGETVIENGNDASLFITTNTDGIGVYNDANTAFYVDGNENFSLGEKLTWDGTNLSIDGSVTIGSNSGGDLIVGSDVNGNVTNISGDVITTGTIQSAGGESSLDLTNGTFSFGSGALSWNGITLDVNGDISGCNGTFTGDLFGSTLTSGAISGTTIDCLNITVANGYSFRADGAFPTGGSGVGALWAQSLPAQGVERIIRYTSLREFKENIEDIPNGLSIINNLRPRIFSWKMGEIDPTTNQPWTNQAKELISLNRSYGFIVEEVLDTQPELVTFKPPSNELPWDQEGGIFDIEAWKPTMWNQIEMIPLLVKSIQELSARVEELESKLNS
jgi:hypothetical protein